MRAVRLPNLSVYGGGMVTALGFSARASLAAMRGGISAIAQTPWVDTESGQPLCGAKVSLPHWWEGLGKLADLVAPAIQECLTLATDPPHAIPLLLAVSAPQRPGRTPRLDEDLLPEVEARLGHAHHPMSRVFAHDQVSGVLALIAAQQSLDGGAAKQVVVAGVDSFLHQPTLDAFIERRRVMTPSNSNGFFPGEAGCAVLVGSSAQAPAGALRILGIGLGREPATINATLPFRAQGITEAVRDALQAAAVSMADVAYRLTDLSGEHYKFKEASFVAGRLDTARRASPMDLWHPIEYLGEIGAAVMPCLLLQAQHAANEGYAPGPLALIHVGSDDGARAACVVTANGGH